MAARSVIRRAISAQSTHGLGLFAMFVHVAPAPSVEF